MTIKAQTLCGQIRHFFAPVDPQDDRCRCGEPHWHPIHLDPADGAARDVAILKSANLGRINVA